MSEDIKGPWHIGETGPGYMKLDGEVIFGEEPAMFRQTTTTGRPPNYHTLHCPCGDGFIWRTDDEPAERADWERRHAAHLNHGQASTATA